MSTLSAAVAIFTVSAIRLYFDIACFTFFRKRSFGYFLIIERCRAAFAAKTWISGQRSTMLASFACHKPYSNLRYCSNRLTPIRTGNTLLEGAGYIPLTMSPPYYKAPCRIERLLQAVCLTCSLHQDAGPPCLGIISGNHFVGANNMVPV